MKNELSRDKKINDPRAEVQSAIDTLNEFNCCQEASRTLQFADLIHFVTHKFSEARQLNQNEMQKKLTSAVNILKQHKTLLPKLEEGTPTEQNFALFAREVINRFNAYLDKIQKKSEFSVKEKIAVFLKEHHQLLKTLEKIELPVKRRRYLDFGEKKESINANSSLFQVYLGNASRKISQLNFLNSVAIPPLPREAIPYLSSQATQLFYMKMIALIEKELNLSHFEARQLVHQANIKSEVNHEKGLCHVEGVIKCLPGHLVIIYGAFEKNPASASYNTPSKQKNFQLKDIPVAVETTK